MNNVIDIRKLKFTKSKVFLSLHITSKSQLQTKFQHNSLSNQVLTINMKTISNF